EDFKGAAGVGTLAEGCSTATVSLSAEKTLTQRLTLMKDCSMNRGGARGPPGLQATNVDGASPQDYHASSHPISSLRTHSASLRTVLVASWVLNHQVYHS